MPIASAAAYDHGTAAFSSVAMSRPGTATSPVISGRASGGATAMCAASWSRSPGQVSRSSSTSSRPRSTAMPGSNVVSSSSAGTTSMPISARKATIRAVGPAASASAHTLAARRLVLLSIVAVSRPAPHATVSFVPLRALTVSRPAPPEYVFFPVPPISLSFPAPPVSRSFPGPPSSVSLPAPPSRQSVPASPRSTSRPARPRSRSPAVVPSSASPGPSRRSRSRSRPASSETTRPQSGPR